MTDRSARTTWLLAAGILLATLVAYQPAWNGGLLWDDSGHVTPAGLRSVHGLWRIWFEFGASQQYYPIVHTAFWLMYRAWGATTLGYHLVNITLHASSAVLVAVVLRRLAVPGAALAAVIFALHPVHVESVAWITELKNCLSGVLFLGALLAYLRFREAGPGDRRDWASYALSFGLFVLALLSKSVTATLPAGLLVIFWWQQGRLSWRQDVLPLVPFFAVGAGAGVLTAWLERTLFGAQGADFGFTLVERVLMAGRAIVFYLGKLAWPSPLIFIYPRWTVSQSVWWQYLYPGGVVAALGGLWLSRRRSRAPAAGLLWFCVTLSPALGFVNVYPFRYSLVADHFQYLASLGIIALVSAGIARVLAGRRHGTLVMTCGIGTVLAVLTWHQAREYVDGETLYRSTLAQDPASWMAHNNLGVVELQGGSGDLDDAIGHLQEAVRLVPHEALVHNNLGRALALRGRLDDAIAEDREALRLDPRLPDAHHNLAAALESSGQLDAAVREYAAVVRLQPASSDARTALASAEYHRGRAFAQGRQFDAAIAAYRDALASGPGFAAAIHNDWGIALIGLGRMAEALPEFDEALRLDPEFAAARANRERLYALLKAGKAVGSGRD